MGSHQQSAPNYIILYCRRSWRVRRSIPTSTHGALGCLESKLSTSSSFSELSRGFFDPCRSLPSAVEHLRRRPQTFVNYTPSIPVVIRAFHFAGACFFVETWLCQYPVAKVSRSALHREMNATSSLGYSALMLHNNCTRICGIIGKRLRQ